MGRKSNYFRHTFNAHKDQKILELIELAGIKAVGVYFVLLELYGAAIIDDDDAKLKQNISVRTIANATGLRSDSCRKMIEKITEVNLIESLYSMSRVAYFQVSIPNFAKYFGSYKKTEAVKSPKKRKEKKRKEKKINEVEIIDLWNTCFAKHDKKLFRAISLGRGRTFENFEISSGHFTAKENWTEFFEIIKNSNHLMNQDWCNLPYILNYDNILKLVNGTLTSFDSDPKITRANGPDKSIILEAISSGADRISNCHCLAGKEKEIEFIKNNGGLLSLSRLSSFDLNQKLKAI